MDVGLTGATGHLGSLLLERLLADPAVTRVRSVARGPVAPHPKLEHTRADIRSPEATRGLEGVDVLWHLGSQLWRTKDQREVNIEGTKRVLGGRPARVVFASSAAVYGAWPDNAVPLDEDQPPRPNAECAYALQKLECERLCANAAPTTVLRVSAVLGPRADPRVLRATRRLRGVVPAMRGRQQALQFLDEVDAAAALHAAGMARADGVFNVAPTDWLDEGAVAAVTGGRVVRLPRRATIALSELAFRSRMLPFGVDRSIMLNGPLALSATKAATAFGWSPTRSSAEVLADAVTTGART